ncbi:MAG: hypothetical protein HKN42_14480 [Granulosicoccus sp.]|nr:hypothetical protein [Granulosicoccus sp.]
MSAQGASDRMIGAAPMAVSQSQFNAMPVPTTTMPATNNGLRPPNFFIRRDLYDREVECCCSDSSV